MVVYMNTKILRNHQSMPKAKRATNMARMATFALDVAVIRPASPFFVEPDPGALVVLLPGIFALFTDLTDKPVICSPVTL